MAIYYVGLGGNDAWNGLTWATRKLTLNGAENVPVVAGDTVYVAPGVYRELLTVDVSGVAGSPITYIGDVSGENTDGVGGVVRITGSDNDQTATRNNAITATLLRSYRTFRGFTLDTTSQAILNASDGSNWIIEDCTFAGTATGYPSISLGGAGQSTHLVQRCIFVGGSGIHANFTHTVAVDNCGHIVQNCLFIGGAGASGVYSTRVGGITVKNCLMLGLGMGVRVASAVTAGQTVTVNNCILNGNTGSFRATVLGEVIENYNSLCAGGAYTNVAVGANTNTYSSLFNLGILHSGASQVSGFRFQPPLFGSLSQWSQVRAIADTGAATEDIFGLMRTITAGKRSWGAVQYVDMARDTATVRTGTASKKLADAGRDQIYVPTIAVSTVFSVWVYREANYAGVNPQLVVKQPGQADTVVTDAGAAGAWNQLTTTLTPAALPGYVVIELVSNNSSAAGAYSVYFDDLTVV